MRFAEPFNLLILVGVALLGLFAFAMLVRKKKLLARFGDIPLVMKIAPDISFGRQATKIIVLLIGMAFLVLVLARLQFGTHMEMLKREGIDIVVALDVSNSMSARDMAPNRLEKAKQELHGIIDRLKGDRIGLIAFAGEAFVQCPLTLDYGAARLLLGSMDQNSVSVQGTSLQSAIELANKSFDQQSKKHKVLLLLTDGEDHEGGTLEAAKEARQQGVKIYTVGIGNPAGEPIPVLDRNGNQMGFRKDENGEVIMTRLDEEALREIALATSGKYYHASSGELELDKIFDEISKMEKKELEGTLVTHYDDRFQWPLVVALLFIIGEFFIPERKKVNREIEHA